MNAKIMYRYVPFIVYNNSPQPHQKEKSGNLSVEGRLK